jgi:hypothetical protein
MNDAGFAPFDFRYASRRRRSRLCDELAVLGLDRRLRLAERTNNQGEAGLAKRVSGDGDRTGETTLTQNRGHYRAADSGARIIRHHEFRHTLKMFQGVHMTVDPVHLRLVDRSSRKSVSAGTENGDKDRGRRYFACFAVIDRDSVARQSTNIFSPARCSCRRTTS